jgi:hypothetical protein
MQLAYTKLHVFSKLTDCFDYSDAIIMHSAGQHEMTTMILSCSHDSVFT